MVTNRFQVSHGGIQNRDGITRAISALSGSSAKSWDYEETSTSKA